jgi:acylphosphatase
MNSAAPVRCALTFSGRVQGVGFRAHCAAWARRNGLKGWVRNLPDGRVACEVEGTRSSVLAFVEAARAENPMARVTALDQQDINAKKDPKESFEILF